MIRLRIFHVLHRSQPRIAGVFKRVIKLEEEYLGFETVFRRTALIGNYAFNLICFLSTSSIIVYIFLIMVDVCINVQIHLLLFTLESDAFDTFFGT